MILSAGDCPTCGVTGKLLFLVAEHNGRIFIACNMCQAAWDAPSPVKGWDHSLPDFAPRGFRPASLVEVRSSGQNLRRVFDVADDEFSLLD